MTKDANHIDITNVIQEYEFANSPILKFFIFLPIPFPNWFLNILSDILVKNCAKKITRYNRFKKKFKYD